MGISNRDYYRAAGSSGGGLGWFGGSMCQTLLIVNIAVYLLQFFTLVPERFSTAELLQKLSPAERQEFREMEPQEQRDTLRMIASMQSSGEPTSILEEWGAVAPGKVAQGQVWRLLTYAFLHSRTDTMHIVFNMLVLWFFGVAIEELLGKREFLAFYLAAAIAAGVCHVLFGFAMHDMSSAVGASGALMGVSMLFVIYYPTAPITIYFLFTIEARWLIILYLIYDVVPILNALRGAGHHRDMVAHAAHLGGLGFGFLYYHFHWRLTDWFSVRGGPSLGRRLAHWWTRPRIQVYQPPAERPPDNPVPRPAASERRASPRDLEHRVDEILKKIKEQGETSLSDEERNLLRDASQAYKKRNS